MGHIAEPKGVDFVIESKPLTDEERQELSEFIKKRKAKIKAEKLPKKNSRKKKSTDNNVFNE